LVEAIAECKAALLAEINVKISELETKVDDKARALWVQVRANSEQITILKTVASIRGGIFGALFGAILGVLVSWLFSVLVN